MSVLLGLWRAVNPLLLALTRNESARQFLNLTLEEQNKLLMDLAHLREDEPPSGKVYQKWSYYFETIREHFQLPCTEQTRRNRAQLLEELCGKNGSILLLGDDDLVSWELARRGFKDVTACDYDAKLLEQLRTLCASEKYPPRFIQGDFSSASFDAGVAPDVVSLDPPYNLRWTHIFIQKALEATQSRGEATLLMMINPFCFSPKDLKDITDRIEDSGFRLVERRERFNGYPLQGLSQFLLRMGLKLLKNPPQVAQGQQLYFSSDLFVFKKG